MASQFNQEYPNDSLLMLFFLPVDSQTEASLTTVQEVNAVIIDVEANQITCEYPL